MRKFIRYQVTGLSLCLLISMQLRAQNNHQITGEFNSVRFDEFIREVEKQANFHFYYDSLQCDSLVVNLKATAVPLTVILDRLFQNTDFHYAIDSDYNVFVTRKYEIHTSLPQGFFESKKTKSAAPEEADITVTDTRTQKENERLRSSLENKLYDIGVKTNTVGTGSATIAGYVRDIRSGEAMIGAAVYVDNPPIGVVTDQFGYFSFTLPKGRHVLKISSVGMKDTKRQVMLYSDGKLNIELQDYVPTLKTIIVTAEKTSNTRGLQMGVDRLNIRTIKQVPVVFGEADVLRAVLTLPGVTSVGEGSTGFNVRGGSVDQNLVLFNDATIYNPSHFFGFFSAFNPDAVKDADLYKSSIPEKYGGRLSSVLDISTRDGNKKKFTGSGGIGALTSRLTLEGPIDSGRTSFLISGRTTYSDWLLKTIPNDAYSNSSASFYDANLNITHEINPRNNLYLTGYISGDKFRLDSDTAYQYSNKNVNLKWKHIFNNQLNAVFTGGYNRYDYSISSTLNQVNAFKLKFDVNQSDFRADFTYAPSSSHSIDFGLTSVYYLLHPGSYTPNSGQSLVVPKVLDPEQGLESAVYLGDRIRISSKFSVDLGIRYSMFNYLGPHDVYNYPAGEPRQEGNIVDTTSYKSGAVIKTYQGPEYRVSARYLLGDNSSIKISYNTLRQYIHLLSNTTSISPIDSWKLSDPNIQPQFGQQVSLGLYKNFRSNTIEMSVEVYYKKIEHYLDYKSGANLLVNSHIETDVFNTRGKAYGVEVLIKKLTGKLNGWVSYTYSRTLLQQDDPIAGETINNGEYYPANYDKPNVVNFIGNYRFSHRFSISFNVNYSTGRPITLPIALYNLGGSERVYYSNRNEYRIPDYFRTDFSMNIEGNHRIKKLAHSSWSIGVYNITGRKNPYSIYFTSENGHVHGYKLSIFGSAIPFITYNFRF